MKKKRKANRSKYQPKVPTGYLSLQSLLENGITYRRRPNIIAGWALDFQMTKKQRRVCSQKAEHLLDLDLITCSDLEAWTGKTVAHPLPAVRSPRELLEEYWDCRDNPDMLYDWEEEVRGILGTEVSS